MKTLIIVAIALGLGALLIWMANFEPGFVLLQYGSWSMETSMVVFSFIFLLLVVAGYLALRSLVLVKKAPASLSAWKASQRHKHARQALTRGLITLEEGRWVEAERLLIKHASNSETPLLHYLAAARAAQKQAAPERRDNYLRLAHETTAGADIAVGVVQAELQLSAGQKEQAIATLQHLREMAPKHPYVLQLLQQVYQSMNQWQEVQAVLPDLRKRHVLDSSGALALSSDAAVGQLQNALSRQDWPQMAEVWQQATSKQRQDEVLLKPYILGLMVQGEQKKAAELIEHFLQKNWSDALVYQYGQITEGDLLKYLATAEKWLKLREDNAALLLTLGRLAKANQLWVKAEHYLRSSIDQGACGEAHLVLAEVLDAQGKNEPATEIYKQGLSAMLAQTQPQTQTSG